MRTDFVELADLPRLAAAARSAGEPYAEALDAAARTPRAERALKGLDDLADRLQIDLNDWWTQRTDARYATFARVARGAVALTLFVVLPAAILLVAFGLVSLLVVPAFILPPLVATATALAVAEVNARRDYAAAAAQFDAAFDALDAATLACTPATCPIGSRAILLGPWTAVYGAVLAEAFVVRAA